MNLKSIQKIKIPDKPGVYFFGKGKQILYIGKATSLRQRTKSYFSKDLIETRGPLLVDMIYKADKLKWEVSDSVLEALILESNLIKKYQPYYNTAEKDDKSFNYVCITKPTRTTVQSGGEGLPKVTILRERELKMTERKFQAIFGPFPHGGQLKEALKIIRRIFPFLDEKSKNYLEFYRQINLAPDLNDRTLYLHNIRNIRLFFSGKKRQIFKNLKKEMVAYSKTHEFEKAGEIKRQMFALQHINDVALLKKDNIRRSPLDFVLRIEAYDVAHMSGKNMVGVMTVVENGEAVKSEYKKFKIRTQSSTNDTGALREILERRLNHQEWTYPGLIVVDGGAAQLNIAHKVLKKLDIKIDAVAVVKDETHRPKGIMGNEALIGKHKRAILLANSEAHRFAIAYHKNMRAKNFLK
jgi:excinuclease ABC subunit C